ncbi:MAG: ABC transporter permease [Bacillota bacterium]|nr:ABC transporter permease [Bacillota bacterium]
MHNNTPAKEGKEPLLRIVRRPSIPRRQAWIIRISAVLLALFTGGILILALGHDPLQVYAEMAVGSMGSKTALVETVKIAIPLLITALAVALCFRMRFWNIGAEGQILIGGIAATYFALFWADKLSPVLLLGLMALAAGLAGAFWGGIPAVFKAKWNTNETLFTLMLNYVALGIEKYLQNGPWKKPGTGFPKIAMFEDAARLPKLFGIHIGWIIALVLVVLLLLYITRSKQGYELSVVGQSPRTARYAGIHVGRVIVRTMLIAGALAGLVGFLQVSGADYTLSEGTAGGVGFTAITVAWLSQLQPLVMVVVAAFIAVLEKGANRIQSSFGIPESAADVLIGIILFFMLGCEFFINYKVIVRGRKGEELHG